MENFQFNWKKGEKPKDPKMKAYKEYNAKEQIRHFRKGDEYFSYENELPQTEQRKALIETMTASFEDRLQQLGVSKELILPQRHFRFFDQAGFDKEFPDNAGAQGFHGKYSIIAAVESEAKKETVMTLFHEMVHAVSAHKYGLSEDMPKNVSRYRVGYQVADGSSEKGIMDESKAHFRAFNEGVVEFTAVSMVDKYQDILEEKGLLTEEENKEGLRIVYQNCIHVVMAIIGGLAKAKNIKVTEVWDQIERGQYTGEMMWMRDMDKVFGKGSLRVLDCLSVENNEENDKKRNLMVWQYFSSEDEEERQKIQEQLY